MPLWQKNPAKCLNGTTFPKWLWMGSFSFVLSPQSSVLSLYDKITYRDFAGFENGFVLQKKPSGQSPFGFKNADVRI